MTLSALLACALLGAAEPPPAPSRSSEEPAAWRLERARLAALGGAFSGLSIRTDSGGLALLEGAAVPTWRTGAWKLELPLRFHHRQTFGASLSETYGSSFVRLENRVSKPLRVGVNLGLSGAWRPDWPDLYQPDAASPLPNGSLALLPTSRYSYVAWHAGASAGVTPFERNHLRIRYEYTHYRYRRDPAFQESRPMHLTPRDNGQHLVEGSWRVQREGYAGTARLEYVRRLDEVYLARHAVTGLTDFYTTPHQRLERIEPSVEVAVKRLGGRLDATLSYGWQIQRDLFEGYYSYAGHHPKLVLEGSFTERLSGRIRGEAWLRGYGPSSKAAGLPPAPPQSGTGTLETGTRLYDRKVAVSAGLSYAVTRTLFATVRGEWVRRDTNYPDYLPGVYPATRLYDIEWSYANRSVLAGVELKL